MTKQSGNIIKVYIDTNPNSPTFGQEKTIIYEDLNHCPKSEDIDADWQEIAREPQKVTYYPSGVEGYNGYANVTYEDVNQDSKTYGETKTVTEKDDNYPMPNTQPTYELYSEYCDGDEYCVDIDPISDDDINALFD